MAKGSVLLDAGIFIGALMMGDPRDVEALPIVEDARSGRLPACTTVGILCEVFAALTWRLSPTPFTAADAAEAVKRLIEPPSHILVLEDGFDAALLTLQLADTHNRTARRIHEARH